MKKLILILTVSVSYLPWVLAQQTDVKSKEILNGVSAKYKTYTSVKADFTLKIEDGQGKLTDTQNGSIYVKGDKYKLELNNQQIICDNKTTWTYLKEANEVQVNNYEPDENSISPTQIFTIYEKNFLYAFIDEKAVAGKSIQTIDLTPIDKSKPYFKIKLTIDKASKTIKSAKVFDKNGNKYVYDIIKFDGSPNLTDTFFSFDTKKYPGIEVVDLR